MKAAAERLTKGAWMFGWLFGELKKPTREEGLSAYRNAIHETLTGKCPICSESLEGHSYSDYAFASESAAEMVKQLLLSFKACDWAALRKIEHIDCLSDIWTVILLKCPNENVCALLMVDYYEPALPLSLVNHKPFDPPSDLEPQQEWLPL
jgi:hypothetical protein